MDNNWKRTGIEPAQDITAGVIMISTGYSNELSTKWLGVCDAGKRWNFGYDGPKLTQMQGAVGRDWTTSAGRVQTTISPEHYRGRPPSLKGGLIY